MSACGQPHVEVAPTPTSRPAVAQLAATATPGPAPTAVATPTIAATAASTATAGPAASTPGPSPQPAPSHTPVLQSPILLSASVRPATMIAGDSFTISVSTRGTVRAVVVSLGSGLPSAPGPVSYALSTASPGKWAGSGTAPAVPGQYHFTVFLTGPDGHRSFHDSDAWNVTVAATTPTSAASVSVPPELLAPPFSYSDPVPATFAVSGRLVHGDEVTSNARADIAPSAVANYYSTHLPRAGWTLSNDPGQGASSFTITATSPSEACVIEYGNATVRVLFGGWVG